MNWLPCRWAAYYRHLILIHAKKSESISGRQVSEIFSWRPRWLAGALDGPVCNQLSFPNVSQLLFTLILCFSCCLVCMKSIPKCVCLCSLDHSSSSCIGVRTQSQYFIQSASAVISALVCTDWLELRKRSRKSSHTLVWSHQSQQDLDIIYAMTDCCYILSEVSY